MKLLAGMFLTAACVWTCAADLAPLGNPDAVWQGARIWKDLKYGPRPDAPGEGEACRSPMTRRDGNGHVVHSHRSGQNYDLLAPDAGVRPNTPVFMNVHGGAWCVACDKDGENMWFLAHLVQRGFLVVNIDYQLQPDVLMSGAPLEPRPHATFLDMLRDIDAAVTHLKTDLLPRLGVAADSLALGGTSAGAHLSLLYGLDQDNPSAMKAGLRHDLRVGFVLDYVGPTDLTNRDFLEPLVTRKMAWGSFFGQDAIRKFSMLLGWLVGRDLQADREQGRQEEALAALRRYSPIHLLTPRSVPVILAHSQRWPLSSTDGCVPVSMYRDMQARLEELGVHHAADLTTFALHGMLKPAQEKWILDNCSRFAARYLTTREHAQ